MGRIRTIKPEFPQSQSMGKVSREARLLFVLIWTVADDSGRTRAASRMLASLLYPYDDDAPKLIGKWLGELERVGSIVRYTVDGDDYLEVCKWALHQKIDRPSKSKFPAPSNPREPSSSPRESSTLDQGPRTKDQGRDQGEDQGLFAARRSSPKIDKAEAIEHDPQFVSFWNTYDRKVAKPHAAKAWLKIAPDEALAAEIIKAAAAYVKATPDPEFRKHPATWLNARGWEDEAPKAAASGGRRGGYDRNGKWQGVPDLKPEDYSVPVTEDNDPFCEHPANLMKRENAQRATKGLPPLSSMAELKILYPEAF